MQEEQRQQQRAGRASNRAQEYGLQQHSGKSMPAGILRRASEYSLEANQISSPSVSSSSASIRATKKKVKKPRRSWSKARSGRPSWAANVADEPSVQHAMHEPTGRPPERGSVTWNERLDNLARRFPDVERETLDNALTLAGGHGGVAGGELIKLTRIRPIDPARDWTAS